MAGRYGMSFAKKHIEDGDYEEAVVAATKDIEQGTGGPEPLFDRGTAHELLEAYPSAVSDFEQAIKMNQVAKELDPFVLDDAYFSALVAAAREEAKTDAARAVATIGRYRELLPKGEHVAESHDWQKRFGGEMPSLLDKTRALNDVSP